MSASQHDTAHDLARLTEVARLLPDDLVSNPELDLLAAMASSYFARDMVLFNFPLTDVVVFAGSYGLDDLVNDLAGAPVEWLGEAELEDLAGTVVRDAIAVEDSDSSLLSTQGVRSLSAVPLVSTAGHVVGSCYLMHREPGSLTDDGLNDLIGLAHLAIAVLEAPMARARHRHPCNSRRVSA